MSSKVRVMPFHMSIVRAINLRPFPWNGEARRLLKLIGETEIPKGHDAIIKALDRYFRFEGAWKFADELNRVKDHVLYQKQMSEEQKGK